MGADYAGQTALTMVDAFDTDIHKGSSNNG